MSSNGETGEDATEKSASEMETTTAEDITKYSGEDCMKCGSWNNSRQPYSHETGPACSEANITCYFTYSILMTYQKFALNEYA